jgi:hypothetical protein
MSNRKSLILNNKSNYSLLRNTTNRIADDGSKTFREREREALDRDLQQYVQKYLFNDFRSFSRKDLKSFVELTCGV